MEPEVKIMFDDVNANDATSLGTTDLLEIVIIDLCTLALIVTSGCKLNLASFKLVMIPIFVASYR